MTALGRKYEHRERRTLPPDNFARGIRWGVLFGSLIWATILLTAASLGLFGSAVALQLAAIVGGWLR